MASHCVHRHDRECMHQIQLRAASRRVGDNGRYLMALYDSAFARDSLILGASLIALTLAVPAAPRSARARPAEAQAAAAAGATEILVTAQFREQRLQVTPIAITAVNSEMLEARSQTNISEIAAQAPNVTLKPQGAAFGL